MTPSSRKDTIFMLLFIGFLLGMGFLAYITSPKEGQKTAVVTETRAEAVQAPAPKADIASPESRRFLCDSLEHTFKMEGIVFECHVYEGKRPKMLIYMYDNGTTAYRFHHNPEFMGAFRAAGFKRFVIQNITGGSSQWSEPKSDTEIRQEAQEQRKRAQEEEQALQECFKRGACKEPSVE